MDKNLFFYLCFPIALLCSLITQANASNYDVLAEASTHATTHHATHNSIDVPSELSAWKAWLLHDTPEYTCPVQAGSNTRQCTWINRLVLNLSDKGGRFTLAVSQFSERPQPILLPVGRNQWPMEVTVHSQAQQGDSDQRSPVTPVTPASSAFQVHKGFASVVEIQKHPVVFLPKGQYTLSGRFVWSKSPAYLDVAGDIGDVILMKEGQRQPLVTQSRSSLRPLEGAQYTLQPLQRLVLQSTVQPQASPEEKSHELLNVEIYRKLTDGIPIQLETEIRLTVSGTVREEVLGRVLPEKSQIIQFTSPLPATVESNHLKVQVKPGRHIVRVISLYEQPSPTFQVLAETDNWPSFEYWSFQEDRRLRTVEISGGVAIDTSQIDLPSHWKGLPTYRMAHNDQLSVETQQRGDVTPAKNKLTIKRQYWLDFMGEGFTVLDHIGGEMHQGWRLNVKEGIQLGRVSVDQNPVLITEVDDQVGVEIRSPHLNIEAVSRFDQRQAIPATGWQTNAESLSATLNLPPGWRPLHVAGVDSARKTWVNDWSLWDIFLCLVIIVTLYKVIHLPAAVVGALYLLLAYHEPFAPKVAWLLLPTLMVLISVVTHAPLRKLMTGTAAVILLTLVSNLVGFAVNQFRLAIYPQVEYRSAHYQDYLSDRAEGIAHIDKNSYSSRSSVGQVAKGMVFEDSVPARASAIAFSSTSSPAQQADAYEEELQQLEKQYTVGEHDVIQTGPGQPAWRWRQLHLNWSGPVAEDQTLAFYLAPPTVTRIWRVVTVFLAALLLLLLIRRGVSGFKGMKQGATEAEGGASSNRSETSKPSASSMSAPSVSASTVMMGVAVMVTSSLLIGNAVAPAYAQERAATSVDAPFPPKYLLDQYQQRLLKPAPCYPHCVAFNQGEILIEGQVITMRWSVSVDSPVSVIIPTLSAQGGASPGGSIHGGQTHLKGLSLNGKQHTLYRLRSEGLEVALPQGVHQLAMRADLLSDQFDLQFPRPVHNLSVQAAGWRYQGLVDGRVPSGVIQFTAQQKQASLSSESDQALKTLQPKPILPFVEVERRLRLGKRWTVETLVKRKAPQQGPFNLSIPLWPNEKVLSEAFQVKEGEGLEGEGSTLQVRFQRNQRQVRWVSSVEPVDAMTLTASTSKQWVESWQVEPSSLWNLSYEGLQPIKPSEGGARSTLQPLWKPWGGETLALAFHRPAGIEGAKQTIEKVDLGFRPGKRLSSTQLTIKIRASQGSQFGFALPEGSQPVALTIDGQSLNLPRDNQLNMALKPGLQTLFVEWQHSGELPLWSQTPQVQFPIPAANIAVTYYQPQGHWPLYLSGPLIGPAMLYWGVLCVIVLGAIVLFQIQQRLQLHLPMSLIGWLLIGIGLSTVLKYGALVVALTFFALGIRQSMVDQTVAWSRFKYNSVQLMLLMLLGIAAITLVVAIPISLLSVPDMKVVGNGSSAYSFHWYQDRAADGVVPIAHVFSLPLLTYRLAMLLWSLWIATQAVKWAVWGWRAMTVGGFWRSKPSKSPTPPASQPSNLESRVHPNKNDDKDSNVNNSNVNKDKSGQSDD